MKKHLPKIVTVFLSIFLFANLSGQTALFQKEKQIGIFSGVNSYSIKDELFSPVIYKGVTAPVGFYFLNKKSNSFYSLQFNYEKSILHTDFSRRDRVTDALISNFSEIWHSGLEFNYLIKVKDWKQFRIFLGGKMRATATYRIHTSIPSSSFDTGYGFLNIHLTGHIERVIAQKHLAVFAFSYAPAAFTMGNQYGRVFTNSAIKVFGNFPNFWTSIKYYIPLNKRLGVNFDYQFTYLKYNKDLNFEFARQQFLMVVVFRI